MEDVPGFKGMININQISRKSNGDIRKKGSNQKSMQQARHVFGNGR
jgi:hypothetical protein